MNFDLMTPDDETPIISSAKGLPVPPDSPFVCPLEKPLKNYFFAK